MVNLKSIIINAFGFAGFVFSVMLTSCSSDEPTFYTDESVGSEKWKNTTLNFTPIFKNSTRAEGVSEYEIEDGDLMIIKFMKNGVKKATGYASYDGKNQKWTVIYTGDIPTGTNESCKLTYIGDNPGVDLSGVDLSKEYPGIDMMKPIFATDNGSYFAGSNSDINLTATLSPYTSRIRFKGDKQTTFEFKGPRTFGTIAMDYGYLLPNAELMSQSLSTFQTNEGYMSPYCYVTTGYMSTLGSYEKCDNIWIKDENIVYLWKKNISGYFNDGASGLISLPSIDPSGWYSDTYTRKDIPDFKLPFNSYGNYSLPANNTTKIYSKIGVFVHFTYYIDSYNDQTSEPHPFKMTIFAHKSDGTGLVEYESVIPEGLLEKDYEEEIHFFCYEPDADYYYVKFYNIDLSARITNFTMSNY